MADQHIDVCQGKYTVVIGELGSLHALRYGEAWRDLAGDKLILCLAQELQNARNELSGKDAK